jgi:RNA polymerase sigma-70 factor (ECF subfamily)
MKYLSDDQLIEQCKQGVREAFNELVRRYQERIYWTIRRFVGDSDDAYDIAQEVFVKAYQGIGEFRGDAQVFTWLYRIAANLSINHVRKRKIRSFLGLDMLDSLQGDPESRPDHVLERNEMKSIIDEAVQTLPEKQKAVFILRYYQELSYEEIAGILDRSVGGLKANYFHAVRKIEEYVKHAM